MIAQTNQPPARGHASPARLIRLLPALLVLQAACTTAPPLSAPEFPHDALFGRPAAVAESSDLFALSPAMRAYAKTHLETLKGVDRRQALLAALYRSGSLYLRYDDSHTRSAAKAFDDRAGNCLSLVLMTAAFAKHLGIPVSYQMVEVDPQFVRRGSLRLSSGHVNLVLGRRASAAKRGTTEDADLTVDFLPGHEVARAATHPLQEQTLAAMFHNNRAVEQLAAGQDHQAYWSSRLAVSSDPRFVPAINTLGVIYQRAGLPAEAQRSYQRALQVDQNNVAALTNLEQVLRQQGMRERADETAALLARLQPQQPFAAFDQGRKAMDLGNFGAAKQLFELELKLQPLQHEVHFWAALANWRLGDSSTALRHLQQAHENSTSTEEARRYSAKLEGLRHSLH